MKTALGTAFVLVIAAAGKQRIKLGDREGAGALHSPDAATKCGDDLCVFSGTTQDVAITRFTRDGKLGEKVQLRIDDLGEHAIVAGANGDLWMHGAVTGTGEPGKNSTSEAGVIFLSRGRPVASAAPSAAAAGAPRGDEPPHETITGAIRGVLRGRPFLASNVKLVHRSGSWRLEVGSARGSLSTQLLTPPKAAAVSVARSAGPGANANAFLPSSENGGMSSDHIGSAAHWVSIERWDVVPYDAKKGGSQDAGYASGRVWIDMPSSTNGKDETSRVVGEFHDAVVRYADDPAQAKKD